MFKLWHNLFKNTFLQAVKYRVGVVSAAFSIGDCYLSYGNSIRNYLLILISAKLKNLIVYKNDFMQTWNSKLYTIIKIKVVYVRNKMYTKWDHNGSIFEL